MRQTPFTQFTIHRSPFTKSDLHDLFLFLIGDSVDFLDELIGRLLDLLLTLFEIVLGQLAVLLHLLELFDGITADVADLNLAVLGDMSDILCDLLTLILGERREDQTEEPYRRSED